MNWGGWPLDRILILFVSLVFLLLFLQVTMFHYPFYFVPWLDTLFLLLMWLGVVDGLIGFYYHFRRVGIRVGGWELRNFLIGPPVILPLMFTALSGLDLIAAYFGSMGGTTRT